MLPVPDPTRSYWIEEAASPLRNCRTTEELPQETDVVIIGSGYSGATTAYWLQKVWDGTVLAILSPAAEVGISSRKVTMNCQAWSFWRHGMCVAQPLGEMVCMSCRTKYLIGS